MVNAFKKFNICKQVWNSQNVKLSNWASVVKRTTPSVHRWHAIVPTTTSSHVVNNNTTSKSQPPVLDFKNPLMYAQTTRPPHEAFTLNPKTYTSEDFYKLEQERVFQKSWVCVGLIQDLRKPGDTIVADMGGKPIFIARDKAGNLNGFLNVCRHRGSKLIRKNGSYPVISCPYHRWGYALDGRLLATPLWNTVEGGDAFDKKTGEFQKSKSKRILPTTEEIKAARNMVVEAEKMATHGVVPENKECDQLRAVQGAFDIGHMTNFDKKDFSLFRVRVESVGCLVFATLGSEKETPSLDKCLGEAADELRKYNLQDLVVVRSKQYDSKANWKLLSENFMEYYHLPSVHPALCKVSGVDNHHRRQGYGQYVGFVTNPLSRGGTPIDPDILPSFPGLKGEDTETAVFHQLFPNVFYFLLPSHIFIVRLDPKSATQTIEHTALLIHPSVLENAAVKEETEVLNKKIDAMMEFYDMTNIEDIEACEDVQAGVGIDEYRGGRVSYRFEETIHRFQNMLIDHMCGYPGRVPLGDKDIPFYIGGQSAESISNIKV